MKKSATVRLTLMTAASLSAFAQTRQDPCAMATFNEHACEVAIQQRGYCWDNRWVKMKYHYPYPYFYDAFQEYLANGGASVAAAVGVCRPATLAAVSSYPVHRAGFGHTGTGQSAHG